MDVDHSQSEEDMDMSDDDLEDMNQTTQGEPLVESKSDPASASDAEGDDDDMVIPGSSTTGRRRNVVGESDAEEQEEEVEQVEEEEEENEEDDELEGQEDELSRASSHSSSPLRSETPNRREAEAAASPAKRPSFKIKLKLPAAPSLTTTRTPSDETPLPASRISLSRDIESEDSNEDDSTRSASVAGPSRMTHRQAALAGVVERTELISLDDSNSKKKKHLNEAELALKREETARKRKNLSEKKLADEKAETINRLLKKQSRARNKRSALATADPDEEVDPDAMDDTINVQTTPLPTLYRWISSNREGTPTISLSIPTTLLVEERKDASIQEKARENIRFCDIAGCQQPMKYKLVNNPSLGGCSLEHWRALQVT